MALIGYEAGPWSATAVPLIVTEVAPVVVQFRAAVFEPLSDAVKVAVGAGAGAGADTVICAWLDGGPSVPAAL